MAAQNPYEPLHDGLPSQTAVPVAQPVHTVVATPLGGAQQHYYGGAPDDDLWGAGLAGTGAAVRRDWRGGLWQCVGASCLARRCETLGACAA